MTIGVLGLTSLERMGEQDASEKLRDLLKCIPLNDEQFIEAVRIGNGGGVETVS